MRSKDLLQLGTRAPYGYHRDEQNRKKLVVDKECVVSLLCAPTAGAPWCSTVPIP